MATTGFWPVKSRLKEVIDYAENPDKTIDKKYVDSDLFAALQYAADDKKTDERMYVSGINCNAKRAYAGADNIRRTMAKGAGTSQTPPKTDSNGKNKLVFGIGILCRLRCKNALRRR